jgi:hypothetical protein
MMFKNGAVHSTQVGAVGKAQLASSSTRRADRLSVRVAAPRIACSASPRRFRARRAERSRARCL